MTAVVYIALFHKINSSCLSHRHLLVVLILLVGHNGCDSEGFIQHDVDVNLRHVLHLDLCFWFKDFIEMVWQFFVDFLYKFQELCYLK